jgi:hypothetical protein
MNEYKITCQLKPYIQPFEQLLAFKELQSLSGGIRLKIKVQSNLTT